MMQFITRMIDSVQRRLFLSRLARRPDVTVGKDVAIHYSSVLSALGPFEFGDRVYVGPWAYLSGPVTIGRDVMVGPRCLFVAADHRFDVVGARMRDYSSQYSVSRIRVGDGSWIAGGVSVLSGVSVGEGAVIGAGSVVVRDVPPYTIAVGNPARVIRARFSRDELESHLHALGRDPEESLRVVGSLLQVGLYEQSGNSADHPS